MASRAQKFRVDLTTSVRHALEDGLTAANGDWTRVSLGDLAERAVDVFAAALDEIHESNSEIPDIAKREGDEW